MPTLEETYYPGASLDLYAWNPPAPPTNTNPTYDGRPPIPTQLSERYHTSIAERVTLPSTPPAVSITLENRLDSSLRRVPHVWTAHVRGSSLHPGATPAHGKYPRSLVAKIYDPVFFDDDETEWDDPFYLRDLTISCEVEAYRRLGPLEGTKVPRFYGYFAAAVPAQHGRTVYVLLLEEVPGRDLRAIVPPDVANQVCAKHKDAIVDAALRLFFDVFACGVKQEDMQPRNVILRPQKHVSLAVSGTRFCETEECLLVHEPDASFSKQAVQRAHIEKGKSMYMKKWLENAII